VQDQNAIQLVDNEAGAATRAQRSLWAWAILARPSAVFGPVDMPPCSLQRPLRSALHLQG